MFSGRVGLGKDHAGRGITTVDAFDIRFACLLTLFFAAVVALGMYNHEMWRDEYEIFMEMRDTPGFFALFPDIQPAPNLYYSLLYPVIKLWPYPAAFQIFHFAVITAAVFVFNRYSPFTKLQKAFFTFSYFVLFEYGIISRDYSMLLLLLFLVIYLVTREKQNYVLIAVGLFLLSNHHIYGVFLSISLFTYLVIHLIKRAEKLSQEEKKKLVLAGIVLITGSLYLLVQYFLSMKFNRFSGTFGHAPLFMTIRSIWNAFFPIPDVTDMHFWNTNILAFPYAYGKKTVAAEFISAGNILAFIFSILVFLANFIILSRRLPVLAAFLVNFSLHLVFLQYLSVFFVRYQGPLFLIFIYCYWLLRHADKKPLSGSSEKPPRILDNSFFVHTRKFASLYVTFVLFIHFCAGLFSYVQDARYPFTASDKAAEYIKKRQLDQNLMVGYIDYVAQTISGHLNQRIFYPQSGEFGTHVRWLDPNRKDFLPPYDVIEAATRLHNENKKNILLILNIPLLDDQMNPIRRISLYNNAKLMYLNEFTESIVADETFFLYLIYHDS